MARRPLLAVGGVLLAVLAGGSDTPAQDGVAADRPAGLTFVYAESNVGGASGGHVALCVGSAVYHYEFDGERICLVREDWSSFERRYADLENRPLHLAHLAVAPADVERVSRHLARLHVEQQLLVEALDRAELDLAWLSAFAGESAPPPLRGAGLLDAGPGASADGRWLAARLAAELGDDGIASRRADVAQRLRSWVAGARDGPPDLVALRELLQERFALTAIATGRGVASQALVDCVAAAPLAEPERRSLELQQEAWLGRVVELLDSSRPDRGFALLVAVARLHAVRRSLALGRLQLLDPFPDETHAVAAAHWQHPGSIAALSSRAAGLFARMRAELLDGDAPGESQLNLLEECAGRLAELERLQALGVVRDHRGRMVPSRGRAPVDIVIPDGDLEAWTADARARAEHLRQVLDARYEYDLIDRNCVTELVRAFHGAFDDERDARRALGGWIEPGSGTSFIPYACFDRVRDDLAVASVGLVPSHRHRELARLYAAEPDALVYAREANTLSATAYAPRRDDGSFLLFTDDVLWVRPIYGVVNLGYALGATVVGVLCSPFDGGERVQAGLRGALFSLPELAFSNIRKGSYEDVPPR